MTRAQFLGLLTIPFLTKLFREDNRTIEICVPDIKPQDEAKFYRLYFPDGTYEAVRFEWDKDGANILIRKIE